MRSNLLFRCARGPLFAHTMKIGEAEAHVNPVDAVSLSEIFRTAEAEQKGTAATLHIKNPVYAGWVLPLQKGNCHVMHRNAGRRLAVAPSIVSMPVQDQIGSVTVDYLR